MRPITSRLSAALKALRLTHEHDGNPSDKKDYLAKCLKVVLAQLFEEGVPRLAEAAHEITQAPPPGS